MSDHDVARRRSVALVFRAAVVGACAGGSGCRPDDRQACGPEAAPVVWTRYQGDDRLGWNDDERELVASRIAEQPLVVRWQSAELDHASVDGTSYPPHLYAVPLWVDDFEIDGVAEHTVFAATSNGWMYAIAADERSCATDAPGTIRWSARLVEPGIVTRLDGGMPLGVLSTPILDLAGERLYATALDRDEGWLTFALDPATGDVAAGWPVAIDDDAVGAVATNGPATLQSPEVVSQRGAMQLSPAGDRLYVPFGTYRGEGVGWLVAVDTADATLVAAFSSAPWSDMSSNGGIWGAAGVTVDAAGEIWATTGNSPPASASAARTWGNSLVHLDRDLALIGTYTPFNYCWLDFANMDIAASPPLLLPTLPGSMTPQTVAFGGKQGNVYLVDRTALRPAADARPPCSDDASGDASLLPPGPQPQFGTRGPLNVFGPYSELFGQLDHAKMRSRLAYAELDGERWLFAAGATKAAEDSEQSVPPSVARLRVVASPGEAAWLEIAGYDTDVAFVNPGSPVVSSAAGDDGVVWVLDENAPRTASLLDPATPGPVLHAFDAQTLVQLWRSDDGALSRGGKYGTPVIAHGTAVVGTDRIVAFGLPVQ